MLPFLIIGLIVAVVAVAIILKGPTKENDTVNEIKIRLEREREFAERKRKNEEEAEALKKERRRMKEMATRKKNEEETRELAREMEELKKKEQMLKDEVEKERKIAERERIARAAEKSGPLRWPTEEEFQHARRVIQYDPANFHFAIVGRAGSGKSSLINAFRNLRNNDTGAAKAGTVETTLETGRYEDPGNEPPRKWMVWFDIPGAGTQRIPHHDYFIKQGLFIFDFIIVAIGDRFEEIDARILENCARFKIPAFIVRSKADMHILNTMNDHGCYDSINDDPSFYIKCRDEFIEGTQKTVSEGLMRQELPDQPVYVVSRDALRQTYNNSLKPSGGRGAKKEPKRHLIHEGHLVKELLTAVALRRCDAEEEQTPLDWVKGKYSAVQERFSNLGLGNIGPADPPAIHRASQPLRALTPIIPDIPQQRVHQEIREIRKMIFPYQETNAQELYDEIAQQNPELPNMLIGHPRMFRPRVAMLRFYPLAPIPTEIYAFGDQLEVVEYRERSKEGRTSVGRGGHTQTTEDKQRSEGYKSNSASRRGSAHRGRGDKGRGRGRGRGRTERETSDRRAVTPPPDYW